MHLLRSSERTFCIGDSSSMALSILAESLWSTEIFPTIDASYSPMNSKADFTDVGEKQSLFMLHEGPGQPARVVHAIP